MDINFIFAQIFGALGTLANISSMQFKKRRHILLALLFLNIFSILNFLCLGELSGTYISAFAILEMGINYLFERKNQPVPKIIVIFYVVVNIVIGVLTFKSYIDIFSILAALTFCFSILLQKEQNIRRTMLANQICWLTYDLLVGAYAFALSNFFTIISTIIAYLRFRKHKTHKNKKNASRKRRR